MAAVDAVPEPEDPIVQTPPASAPILSDAQASGPAAPSPKPAEPIIVVRAEPPVAPPAPDPPALDRRVDVAQIAPAPRDAYVAQLTREHGATRLAVRQGDRVIGAVGFQVSDGRVAVHIGQVLDLFQDRMEDARFAALRGSEAAQQFVALETIRQAGVPLRYDAVYDELVLGDVQG